jgi:hypothetical protein
MDEATVQAIREIAEALRADLSGSIDALSKRCDALAEDVKANKKSDEAGERDRGVDGTMAVRVAADAVDPAAFAALASSVADMQKKRARPMKDLNAYADAQAKADSVMRALGSAAEPPMAGEDLVSYKIRMHRKMQPHSPRWKGVELQLIAADQVALDNVLGEIRADAMTAAMSPVGMPEFQHRMITKTMPGGHIVHEFIGNGTIFKQLSRPVRHVAYIGTRN